MATTEFIVTEADIGVVFPPEYHFVLSLVRSRPPHNCHYRMWSEKHFVLRDTKATQNLICIGIDYGSMPLTIGGAQYFLNNRCIEFYGQLQLLACQFGAEWEITLSDIFVAPRLPLHPMLSEGFAPNGYFGAGNRTPHSHPFPPPPRQLELAAPPLMIASPVIEGVIERER